MNSINLLPKKGAQSILYKKYLKILRFSSYGVIGFVLIAALATFFLHLSSPIPALVKQEQEVLGKLNSGKAKVARLTVLHERLKEIESILKERSVIELALEDVAGKVPSNTTVTSFSIDKEDVNIVISSSSLTAIDEFLKAMVDLSGDKKLFKKVTLNGVTLDQANARYGFSIQGDLL